MATIHAERTELSKLLLSTSGRGRADMAERTDFRQQD